MSLLHLVPSCFCSPSVFPKKNEGFVAANHRSTVIQDLPRCFSLKDYSGLPAWSPTGSKQVRPRCEILRWALRSVSCTHPQWGVRLGPGSGR